ncbi:hypothetical protein EYZ11_012040 [Aspergillus tanneri]|uniref:DNA-directed RNA polymerase I subunit rpa34 n=1 Tax=Aspergillus tanneri TaxID=1220188 RepID=A0A4S3J1J6_9EURO|nr:uncharacterized protein ATNIH1004_005906 [Aspergillus tanneri]KAA8647216.1 hypothetical protein ATNIH1004_005906 [Aspergillus tanneri]THC88515.1 hypothetical protein EYZ11_012040 [Aspergillus tanneri]
MAPKSTTKSNSDSDNRSTSPQLAKNTADSSSPESEQDSSKSSSESDSDGESATSSAQESVDTSDHVAAKPYKAPSGFKTVKKQSPPSSSITSLLSDLRDKQVFHVSAPASLPLSKVKEISLAKVMQGEPVLKHEGVDYGIPVDSISNDNTGGKMLLTYDPKTQTYGPTTANNIQSYHVRELVNLPERSETEGRIVEAAQEQVVPPRKQPKHLKMRFRPMGSQNGPAETIGSSSEESEGEVRTFKISKGSNQDREERKRKHHSTEGEGSLAWGVPRKKSKQDMDGVESKEKKKSSKKKDEKKRKKSGKAT